MSYRFFSSLFPDIPEEKRKQFADFKIKQEIKQDGDTVHVKAFMPMLISRVLVLSSYPNPDFRNPVSAPGLCQLNQALLHFVLDFLYRPMLINCVKTCLGIFASIAEV